MTRFFYAFIIFLMSSFTALEAQTVVFHENFEPPSGADSVTAYSSSATNTWGISSSLSSGGTQSDSARCSPHDTLTLTTDPFSTLGNAYVILEFDHICKIEAFDKAIVEVSSDGGLTWTQLNSSHYMGGSAQFASGPGQFNATSYGSVWYSGQNITPDNTWWKHETFNISSVGGDAANVQIRFSLIDVNGATLFENYGWFLDNIMVTASISEMIPPEIKMATPIVQDTVTDAVAQTIKANITDDSGIDTAFVVYYINNIFADTLGMTNFTADSFQVDIPFPGYGRTISYFVEAIDLAAIPNHSTSPTYSYFLHYVPGSLTNVIFTEGFNAGTIPSSWTVSPTGLWEHGTGTTPSVNTGPNGAHEGSGYVFLESSTSHPNSCFMESPQVDVSSLIKPYLTFYYHMFGASMGTLEVDVHDGSTWHNAVWSISGEQHFSESDPWTRAMVDLSQYKSTNLKIRFTGTTTTTWTSDMAVDFVQIGETVLPVPDAGIAELTNPTGGVVANTSFDVKATFKNFGGVDLTQTDIYWELNGSPKPIYNWTGLLPPDSTSAELTLGTEAVPQGPHSLKLWTANPNDTVDFNIANDTLYFDFYGCTNLLNGTYTIGGTSPQFNSFSDAALGLIQCGIDGPVTFNVAPGTYNEQIFLPAINGASDTNTILFQSATADSSDVILAYDAASSADNYVVELDGAAHITFQHMTFEAQDTGHSRIIVLGNQAHNLSFLNNRFITPPNPQDSDSRALVYSRSPAGSQITFSHNEFVHGSTALIISGNNNDGVAVTHNLFTDQYAGGMTIAGAQAPLVSRNYLNTPSDYDSFNAVLLSGCSGSFEVSYNQIYVTDAQISYGLRASDCHGDSLNHARMYNNMVLTNSALGTTTLSAGILHNNSRFVDYYFNTVKMTGSDQNSPAFCLFDNTFGYSRGVVLKNNILTNFADGYVWFTMDADTSGFINNYNNLYADGTGDFANLNGAVIADLSGFQSATGGEANSLSMDPYFPGPMDLHTTNNLLNGSGTPIAGITDDIDGDPRDPNHPDMGADEFDPSPYDLAVLQVVAPWEACGLTSAEPVTVSIKNAGSAQIDTFSVSFQVVGGAPPVTEQVTTPIVAGDTMAYTFNATVDMDVTAHGQDSVYPLKAWVDYVNDPIPNNDTAIKMVNSRYEPPAPVVTSYTIDYGTTATLTAVSNDSLFWFASDTASDELAAGEFFTTPPLFDTTTYYVSALSDIGLGGFIITEICHFKTANGAPTAGWPAWLMADDYIEITGSPGADLGGYTLEQWSASMDGTYTFPQGTVLSPQGTAVIAVGQLGGSMESPANFYYHGNGTYSGSYGSSTAAGRIIKDPSGEIIDAVGYGNYTFPPAAGVTPEDWSGTTPPGGGTAGNRLEGPYTKDATNWISSSVSPQDPNAVNPGVTPPSTIHEVCQSPRVPVTVNVINHPQNDAGVTQILNPEGAVPSGVQQYIDVEISNFGLADLTAVDISWALDGQTQHTHSWTGTLPYAQKDTVRIDSTVFGGGYYSISAWTSMPNNVADTITVNDTTYATFSACLSGTYTIGDTATGTFDFPSFNAAVIALDNAGVCGNVVFEAAPGLYQEYIEIQDITGADQNNTITFTSATKDSTDVILEGAPPSNSQGVVLLNEAQYITFSHMTIRVSPVATTGIAVYLDNQASHNTLNNCVIQTQPATNSNFAGIYASGSANNYNVFKNNHIKNGYYGVYWRGQSTSILSKGCVFHQNRIEGFNYYGMYFYHNDSVQVTNNVIKNELNSGLNYGIYAYYIFNGFRIANNDIQIYDPANSSTKYGMRIGHGNRETSMSPGDTTGFIYNNMIYVNSTGSKYGMYNYWNNDVENYYNTVVLSGSGGFTVRPLYQTNTSSNNTGETYVNNIFINEIDDYAAYYNSTGEINHLDHNNYYANGSVLAYWGTDQATLSDLQNASGMDANSLNLLPAFEAHNNLRLLGHQMAEQGTPVPAVPYDIDGKPRATHATSIGAYEKYLVPIDVGIQEILVPDDSLNADVEQAFSVIVRNFGTDTLPPFDVKYSIDNGGEHFYTFNQNLPPQDLATIVFPDTLIMPGHQHVCFTTVLAEDTMPANDQMCKDFYGIPEYDVGIIGMNRPDSGFCYSASELVQVRMKNFGHKSISFSTHPVEVEGYVTGPNPQTFNTLQINSGSIASGAIQNFFLAHTYDMSVPGDYTFHARTTMASDGDTTNDHMASKVYRVEPIVDSFPYIETFENFTLGNGVNHTGEFIHGWSTSPNVYDEAYQWYVHSGETPTSGTGPQADHTRGDNSGKYVYVEASNGTFQNQAELISPCIDLSQVSEPVLRFFYHMAGSNVYSLRVDINNGTGWQNSVGFIIGSQQQNSMSPWEQEVIDLTPYVGQTIKIRFRAIRGPGESGDIAIDDVMIYEPPPVELAVKSIHLPNKEMANVGSLEPIQMEVENLGKNVVKVFDMGFYAGDMQPVTEGWSGNLAPFQSVIVDFNAPYQVRKGNQPLKVFVKHQKDNNPYNDTAYYQLTGFGTEPIPYFDDFEGEDYWRPTGQNTQWERGTPAGSVINSAYSGSNAWATGLDQIYGLNTSDMLYTPYLDFATVQGATLEFYHWYDTDHPSDGGFIQYTANYGGAWQMLGTVNDPLGTNWYNEMGNLAMWSGSSNGWVKSTYDLSQFDHSVTPIQFRFVFASYSGNNQTYNGWAIDDFAINLPTIPTDAGVTRIMAPESFAGADGQQVQVRVRNYGSQPITNIPLEYTVNGASPVNETWNGTLQPGEDTIYTFNTPLNVSPTTAFDLCVTTSVAGDTNTGNDEICREYSLDAGVTYVMNPLLTSFIGDSVKPAARIANLGSDTIYQMDLYYRIWNDPAVTEQWNGILAPGKMMVYAFDQKYQSPAGYHQICAGTDLDGDVNPFNDESCKYVTGVHYGVFVPEYTGADGLITGPCFPNPAERMTTIPIIADKQTDIDIKVFDITGRKMLIHQETIPPGENHIQIELKTLSQGVYIYRVSGEMGNSATGKLIIMR